MTLALVLGAAACLWDDVAEFATYGRKPDKVVACNDAIAAWPGKLDAAVSYHPELFPKWLKMRAKEGYEPPALVLGHRAYLSAARDPGNVRFVDPDIPGQTTCGSSGLFALKVALFDLACDRAVLCGVPMVDGPHFQEGEPFTAADEHRVGWREARWAILETARSMSGWTRALLGVPTTAWLA